ncbi:hypothetical protein BGX20_004545 [Mortierella sp. AD010]|nr:hypothetical protein BGX20_004545 [Mortierella sp. AD010]
MFVQCSLFTISVILAIFQLLLCGALNSILSILTKSGCTYSSSIRWIRQGGYFEMFHTLFNSHSSTSHRVKFSMVVMIISSLAASLTDKGVTRFISIADHQKVTSSVACKSWQSISLGLNSTFSGWSTSIFPGDNIVDAMKLMINSSRNIPRGTSGNIFMPRSTEYQIQCNQFDFGLNGNFQPLQLANNGCLVAELRLPVQSSSNVTVIKPSNGRWSITVPDSEIINNVGPASVNILSYPDRNELCRITEMSPLSTHLEAKEGLSNLPVTLTKKCALDSAGTVIMSTSTIWFSSQSTQDFSNITGSIFQGRDDLVQSMEAAVSNMAYGSNTTLLIEARTLPSVMEAVLCFVAFNPNGMVYVPSCLYITTNAFSIMEQEVNPILAAVIGDISMKSESSMNYLTAAEYILPRVNGTSASVSVDIVRNTAAVASQYMASLAYSFYADLNDTNLYVLFDVITTYKGLEIPEWLIICIGVAMVACFFLWAFTQYLLDRRYTGSLYKLISIQMSDRTNVKAPMLMRCKVDTLEFEGILIGFNDIIDFNTDLSKFNSTETLLRL